MGKDKRKKGSSNFFRKYKTNEKIYSHGVKIDKDLLDYCIQVSAILDDGPKNKEEKELLVTNIFSQISEHEVDLACNQNGSRLLERLIDLGDFSKLADLSNSLSVDLRKVCTNQYGSHVIEALMRKINCLLKDGVNDSQILKPWIDKMFRYSFNNYSEFMHDKYGCYILKCSMECLTGVDMSDYFKNKSIQCLEVDPSVSEEYGELLDGFASKLCCHRPLSEFIQETSSCTVLQALLFSMKSSGSKLLKSLVNSLFHYIIFEGINYEASISQSDLNDLFNHELKLRLFEAIIIVCKRSFLKELYRSVFKLHLENFVNHRIANHTLQVFVMSSSKQSKELFEEIFTDLVDLIPNIFSCGAYGILIQLARGCQNLVTNQSTFYKAILEYLGCWEDSSNSIYSILALTKNSEKPENSTIKLQGSLLAQSMLCFHKPQKLVKSLLGLSDEHIHILAEDPSGSHVITAYMKSVYVGSKNKQEMISKMKSIMRKLACSRYGSRSLDSLWEVASLNQKSFIIEQLLTDEKSLHNNVYGRKIHNNYGIWLYQNKKEEWKKAISNVNARHNLMGSIINYGNLLLISNNLQCVTEPCTKKLKKEQ